MEPAGKTQEAMTSGTYVVSAAARANRVRHARALIGGGRAFSSAELDSVIQM
jgi:hypothetical protein